jgi:hypothetical protein
MVESVRECLTRRKTGWRRRITLGIDTALASNGFDGQPVTLRGDQQRTSELL